MRFETSKRYAMIAANTLELTVVTPETTLLSEQALSVQFPLEDGQIGIFPNRAPLVGKLGIGELLVTTATEKRSYFIDGGFAQVKGNTVTLLTNEALRLGGLDATKIEAAFQEALHRKAITPAEQAARQHDMDRNRKLLALINRR